jgi:hypothetical protein
MSSYHIAKDGKQTGPLDEETIRQQIATGALSTSDLCWCGGMDDWQSIGTVFSFAQQAGAPPPLTSRAGSTTSSPHQLTTFPVAVAVLLHYVTFGIFTLVWLNLMHGKMDRVRTDDPSAGKAVGFCFIPFFNLYWIFFTYQRLCLRIDEQRDLYGLPPGNLRALATTTCVFQIIPYINLLLGYTIMTPIFIGMMQSSVNQLVHTSATTAPRATLPASLVPARGMSGGAIAAIVCACLIPFIGLLAAIAIPSFVKARTTSQRNACLNNMRMIDAAKEQAALEHNYRNGDTVPEQEVSTYVKNGLAGLVCHKGGRYTIKPLGEEPECSEHGSMSAPIQRR